jgi:hypothetical protein
MRCRSSNRRRRRRRSSAHAASPGSASASHPGKPRPNTSTSSCGCTNQQISDRSRILPSSVIRNHRPSRCSSLRTRSARRPINRIREIAITLDNANATETARSESHTEPTASRCSAVNPTRSRIEERSSMARPGNPIDQSGQPGIGRSFPTAQVAPELRVGQFQQDCKRLLLVSRSHRMVLLQIVQQQHIQFLHAAPATPAQPARGVAQRRSTINFLISPMALAGFSPLGQVLVQFMMVWQRYSRNGSSRSSSRSPVYSSRESAIQR